MFVVGLILLFLGNGEKSNYPNEIEVKSKISNVHIEI